MRGVLSRLAKHAGLWVGIVSGRRSRTLARLIRVEGIHYRGVYGAETGEAPLKISPGARRALSSVRRTLARELRRLAGVWTEYKGLSLVVHYRGARRSAVTDAERILRGAIAPARRWLRLIAGAKSLEVVPREISGKGAAVAAVMQSLPAGSVGIYIGDAAADEEAFGALASGITIRVGRSGESRARYFLRSPVEVLKWLICFERALP
jgi:trehalose 6-phosphate phosphatase